MATKLPYFKPRTQKWLAVLSIAGINSLPMMLAHCVFGFPLLSMLLLQVASLLINLYQNIMAKKPYDKVIDNDKENPFLTKAMDHFKKIIAKLSKKGNIKEPEVIFTQSHENNISPASTASKGTRDFIGINVKVLDWFFYKSPPANTESILAHEISHIIHRDYQTDLIINLLNKTLLFQKNVLYAMALCSLVFPLIGLGLLLSGATIEFFLLTLPITSGLAISAAVLNLLEDISRFANGTYNRAVEYLADEGAVKLTNDPVSVALIGYEIKYEILHRKQLTLADNDPIKLPITTFVNNIEAIACKKGLSKGLIYQQACKWLKNNPQRLPIQFNLKKASHTHPSTKQRFKAIKLAAPEAFETFPTLTKNDFHPQKP